MKIGIDLGGSHIGIGLIEGYELKATVDKFFVTEDRKDMENAILRNIDELINKLLIENTENTYFKQILNKILKELKSGKRIYKTMNQYTNIFPPVYINFIKTGELTGNLKEYLKHAITYLEDEEKIKSKITENLIPSIAVFIGIMLLTIISVFIVIPGFQEILPRKIYWRSRHSLRFQAKRQKLLNRMEPSLPTIQPA